ncbi:hypothetical protein SAMN05421638_0586 [Kaistella treverensis]|uniref:Uncharacterized protein n=1 Tax=Kaistella treverensis TaxID=631455 RepID=A0A1I3K4F5_9FLAO|nr:hypothetical protein [Kaistella treverensis]SFI67362.1 hypothetical protein SAMN05421638_0586 [Kaistella treverensis]
MKNSLFEARKNLIGWIESLDDAEVLQKLIDIKNSASLEKCATNINSEKVEEQDFDQQFAAGMTPDELLENIASHIESIDSEENI